MKSLTTLFLLFFCALNVVCAQKVIINAILANNCITTSLADVEQDKEKLDFTIYPNPGRGTVNLQVNASVNWKNLNIQVIDISGRKVYERKSFTNMSSPNFILNFDNLKAGIYLVTIQTKGSKTTKKLIVSR